MPICARCQQWSGVRGSDGELVAGLGTQVKADLNKNCREKPAAGAFKYPEKNGKCQVLPTGQ